ncbi:MAG: NUDIX domain-containing protein [Lachnospiraceae bacterium]|nr:NUDIX domain-containing protein [Lachnospiraceae bacterium]
MEKNTNVIAVFDKTGSNVLMCRRRKDPFKGLLNLVGGKIEPGEDAMAAAYRELEEETGITRADIRLIHMMDFTYHLQSLKMEVYYGFLEKEITVHGEENELFWIDRQQDYADEKVFAGYGNLGHIMALIEKYEKQ